MKVMMVAVTTEQLYSTGRIPGETGVNAALLISSSTGKGRSAVIQPPALPSAGSQGRYNKAVLPRSKASGGILDGGNE